MGAYKTKQYIIVRKDLNMPAGKLAAQAAHASVGALFDASYDIAPKTMGFGNKPQSEGLFISYQGRPAIREWVEGDFTKVCLAVDSEDELRKYYTIAREHNLPCAYIVDNGTTVFHGVPTPTCIGVGPAYSEHIEPLFKDLRLYK